MPNYRANGTENLRSNPATKHAATPDQPSASGKDVGGRSNPRANQKELRAENPKAAGGSYSHKVEGVQTFSGDRRV